MDFCKWIVFAFFSLTTAVSAQNLVLEPKMVEGSVGESLLLFEDATGKIPMAEILSGQWDTRFKKANTANLGFSKSRFWIRLAVKNPTQQEIRWILEYDFPLLDEISIYSGSLPETYFPKLGDSFPFPERNLDYRNPTFPLVTPAQSSQVYYLRIESESTIPLHFRVWTESEFFQKVTKEQILFGIFYGIMFVMVAYNFFIYIFTYEKSYLFYLFFISSISFFHLSNNGFAFQYLWPSFPFWANYSVPFFIIVSCITGLLFTENYLYFRKNFPRGSITFFVAAAFLALFGCALFFIPYRLSMLISIGLTVPTAIFLLICSVLSLRAKMRTARYYIISWSFFLLGVILYSLKSLGILPDNGVTRWTIQIGTALQTILLSLGLADRINFLSRSLRENLRELSFAKTKIEESERRFREIFQGSDEVILMMNEEFEILNANRALSKHLGFRLEDVRAKPFIELLYSGKNKKAGLTEVFVKDKLTDLQMTGSITNFMTEFSQKYVKEPKEMYCRLQYIHLGETREVIATLSPQFEDTIIQLIESEKIEISMNNYLRNAELVSQKITTQLAKVMTSIEQTEIRSSIREIIINAVEHGNLNISFEEKTSALLEGNYLEFLQKRQEDPRYRDKRVKIEYSFAKDFVAYRVTDEGKGFDHKKYLERKLEDMNETMEQHGRGILMSKSVFNRIEYNDRGNQVTLIKYLNKDVD